MAPQALTERDARFLEAAFERLEICDATREMIACTHREVDFDISLRLVSGELVSYRGYRVQHDCNLGPFKGGLRFHPDVDRGHLRELAAAMTWKTALHELPLGGAKGGVDCDPRELDKRDLRTITHRYVARVGELVGPEMDIPAPDMGTDEETMAWFYDAYGQQHGDQPGVVTGKPLALHGSHGREAATGDGAALITRLACGRAGIDPAGARVALHGFGNVASHAAVRLAEQGARVVAISDSSGALHHDGGLDVGTVKRRREEARRANERVPVTETGVEGEPIGGDELLELDVDVLIPAAIEYVIDEHNSPRVQARLVVEAANLPMTAAASEALEDRGTRVIPDILANAGGVIVSYLEWVQNRQGMRWPAQRVQQSLEQRLQETWQRVCEHVDGTGRSHRQAAFDIAVAAINTAIDYRGV